MSWRSETGKLSDELKRLETDMMSNRRKILNERWDATPHVRCVKCGKLGHLDDMGGMAVEEMEALLARKQNRKERTLPRGSPDYEYFHPECMVAYGFVKSNAIAGWEVAPVKAKAKGAKK